MNGVTYIHSSRAANGSHALSHPNRGHVNSEVLS